MGIAPLVLLGLTDARAALAALVVAAAVAFLAHVTTRRSMHALAAASLAVLFLPPHPLSLLAAAMLALLLGAAHVLRVPYLLALAAPAFVVADPSGPWLAATALAVLAAVPAPSRTRSVLGTHGAPILATVLLLAGAAFAPVPAIIGLVAGFAGRVVVHHPARPRLAAVVGRAGLWGALLPAVLLLLMASLGRVPVLGPREALLVGWATVGLGVLFAVTALGLEVGLRSRGFATARAAVVPLAALGVPAAFLAAGALTTSMHLAGLAWAPLAPAAVMGVQRLGHAVGRHGAWVGLAAAAAAMVALPVRLLF